MVVWRSGVATFVSWWISSADGTGANCGSSISSCQSNSTTAPRARAAALATIAAASIRRHVSCRRTIMGFFSLITLASLSTIEVHLVPHSHLDTGWLKTVDQCYIGANNTVQHAGVRYIIEAVVAALLMHETRTFAYAEQAFFVRWWQEQDKAMKSKVKGLVQRGQLMFVDGGWSQHDEGCLHYSTMIDQSTLGSSFLATELGVVPTIGWHMDPFGHTSTQAALLSAEAGFDAFYFARIDYQDRNTREEAGTMEMVWRASPSLGRQADLFSGALVQGAYCAPPELSWPGENNSPKRDGEPVCTDPALDENNGDAYVERFVALVQRLQRYSQGGHVMLLMGCDYEYENAAAWYTNMDRLIRAVNADGRVHANYSDPVRYTRAKHDEQLAWTVKSGDDFTPACQEQPPGPLRGHMYWSGYFTSRPALKLLQRKSSAHLQTARQLHTIANLAAQPPDWTAGAWSPHLGTGIAPLAAAVALTSHHDAVTGTSRQHVANDYAKRLALGQALADVTVHEALRALTGSPSDLHISQCKQLNESICEVSARLSDSSPLLVFAYNPLGIPRDAILRIPIHNDSLDCIMVTDEATTHAVSSSLLPSSPWASREQEEAAVDLTGLAPAGRMLVFTAPLPPLGVRVFRLATQATCSSFTAAHAAASTITPQALPHSQLRSNGGTVTLEDTTLAATFSTSSGRLVSLRDKSTGVSTKLSQAFFYYTANNSGPWMLRPDQSAPEDAVCAGACTGTLEVIKDAASGAVIEVHQRFGSWVAQAARVVDGMLEVEWTIGPVPVMSDGHSKEVFSRFSSDVTSEDRWLTDSNGWETTSRRRNHRDSFTLNLTEPIAANVVGVNAFASIDDARSRGKQSAPRRSLTVCNDRSQGGTSLRAGELDLFVHRRLLGFDYPGGGMGANGEPLNETRSFTWEGDTTHWRRDGPGIVVRGVHRVGLSGVETAARMRREAHERLFRRPLVAFATPNAGVRLPQTPPTGLLRPLPINVALLSLERLESADAVLLRLVHKYAIGEDAERSRNATVSLHGLFAAFEVLDATELSLFANARKADVHRLVWRTREHTSIDDAAAPGEVEAVPEPVAPPAFDVLLTPLKVRTFRLKVAARASSLIV